MNDVTELFAIFYNIVKAWPATYPTAGSGEYVSKRPNTFAVMRSLRDIEAPNLEKSIEDAKEPYFYMRDFDANEFRTGQRAQYPVFGCAEDAMDFRHPMGTGAEKQLNLINCFIIDQLPFAENGYSDPYSSGRTIEEVGRDLKEMALKLLKVLGRWAKVQITMGDFENGWHDTAYLKAHGAMFETELEISQIIHDMDKVKAHVIYQNSDNNAILLMNMLVETNQCADPEMEMNYVYNDGGALASPTGKWVFDR
jgi:hypothetical protein